MPKTKSKRKKQLTPEEKEEKRIEHVKENAPRWNNLADQLQHWKWQEINPNVRILLIQDILCKLTDSKEGLKGEDIAQIIARKDIRNKELFSTDPNAALSNDIKLISQPTIQNDIRVIERVCPFGMVVDIPAQGKTGGYKSPNSALETSTITALSNLANASLFADKYFKDHLQYDLGTMLSKSQLEQLKSVIVDSRERPDNQQFLKNIEAIQEAIAEKKQIEFRYMRWDYDNKEKFDTSSDGSDTFHETPLNLIFSYGNYYVETCKTKGKDSQDFTYRRVERMRDVKCTSNEAARGREIYNRKKSENITNRLKKTFDMRGRPEKEATLFLEVKGKRYANVIYNRFGKEIKFEHQEYDENGEPYKGYIKIQVFLSNTFYRWIFGFEGNIKIVCPKDAAWMGGDEAPSWKAKKGEGLSHEKAIEYYNKAIKEYRHLIKKANEMIDYDLK